MYGQNKKKFVENILFFIFTRYLLYEMLKDKLENIEVNWI